MFVVVNFSTLVQRRRSSQKRLQVALQQNPAPPSRRFTAPSVDAFKTISESSTQVI